MKTKLLLAWLMFFGLLVAIFIIDYVCHLNELYALQNDWIWFGSHLLAAIPALLFLINSAKGFKSSIKKTIYLLINLFVGFILYSIVLFLYVIESGIDSI